MGLKGFVSGLPPVLRQLWTCPAPEHQAWPSFLRGRRVIWLAMASLDWKLLLVFVTCDKWYDSMILRGSYETVSNLLCFSIGLFLSARWILQWCRYVNASYKMLSLARLKALRLWREAIYSWVRCDTKLSTMSDTSCYLPWAAPCSVSRLQPI